MASNPYMTKTEALLREGKAKLEGLRARTEKAGAEARTSAEKKLKEFEARYADVSRRFDELRNAGTHGVAEIKIGLEKAWDAFAAGIGRPQ
jgi:predicted secreted Zn-dependent protease